MSEETMEQKPSLIGMITNPTEQFERIKERPVIWGAMGIIIILFMIGMWLTFLGVDLTGEISNEMGVEIDEELEGFIEFFENVGIFLGGIIGPIIGVLISSIIFLLVGKIVNSSVTFRQLFSMNTYIMIITALGVIVNGILFAIFGGESDIVFTSLGFIMNGEGPSGAIANHLEVFSIWNLVLTAIGLEKVARFSKGLAWAVPIIIFIVGMFFEIANASMQL